MPRHPVNQTDAPLTNEEARKKVGDFVRRALLVHRRLAATGWPTEVGWDDVEIWATARRGDLVLRTERRHIRWWSPSTREHALELAESLARVLLGTIAQYKGIDDTGRVHLTLWHRSDGDLAPEEAPDRTPARYVLEPGYRVSRGIQGSAIRLYGIRDGRGCTVAEALERGIIRPEDGS